LPAHCPVPLRMTRDDEQSPAHCAAGYRFARVALAPAVVSALSDMPEAVGKRRPGAVSRWISTTAGGPSHPAPLGHAQLSPWAGPVGAALWSFQHRPGFSRQPPYIAAARAEHIVHGPVGQSCG